MDKKKQMNFNLNNFLLAVTDILDVRDIEANNVSKSHSLRIAYVSLKLGKELKLEPKEMFDLCAYSLFHNYINDSNSKLFGINNTCNKLSNIVNFVHQIEEQFDFSINEIENRYKIIESVKENSNTEYKEYKESFLKISSSIDFWMDCQSPNMILQYIYSTLYDFTEVLTFEEVLNRTKVFGSLYEDVNSLLVKCKKMIHFYNFEEKDQWTFLIAASMLNFGKLSVPKRIIEKKDKLTVYEYEMLKSNIYHNKNALRSIYGFDDIATWATRHQEQLDGNGYPSQIKANDLSLKDRLMSVLNIYNSLISNKVYRKEFTHKEAVDILKVMEKNYYLDTSIVKDIEDIFS